MSKTVCAGTGTGEGISTHIRAHFATHHIVVLPPQPCGEIPHKSKKQIGTHHRQQRRKNLPCQLHSFLQVNLHCPKRSWCAFCTWESRSVPHMHSHTIWQTTQTPDKSNIYNIKLIVNYILTRTMMMVLIILAPGGYVSLGIWAIHHISTWCTYNMIAITIMQCNARGSLNSDAALKDTCGHASICDPTTCLLLCLT